MARGGEEGVERIGAAQGGRERDEVDRQEYRERKSRQAVQQRRDESRLGVGGAHHARYRAHTAVRPRATRASANRASATSSERERHTVHSRAMLRSPIGAWIATASTNTA